MILEKARSSGPAQESHSTSSDHNAVHKNVQEWATKNLEVCPGGVGLDLRQLMQQWSWQQFSQGQSTQQTSTARKALPEILEGLGAVRNTAKIGDARYYSWSVRPKGWIVGRRDLPRELLNKLNTTDFEFGPWLSYKRQSFGEAAGELLWTFRSLEIVGVLGGDIGYMPDGFSRKYIPGYPELGDRWTWRYETQNPLGEGLVGLSLYEIREDILEDCSRNA